jgi:hypothetical protein
MFPALVPKDTVFDINKIVTAHSVYEFLLKKTAFPEETHLNVSIPPYGTFYLPFHFLVPPEIIAATLSAFISSASFTCYNSLFRSPLTLQGTITVVAFSLVLAHYSCRVVVIPMKIHENHWC